MRLFQLSSECETFPPVEMALKDPNGLLAIGGDLSVKRMLSAYHQGIFPWFSEDDPLLWWCPDPRAVLYPDEFHLSRSMRRFHRTSPYRVTLNHAFDQVIKGCATYRSEETWITPEVIDAWRRLFRTGKACSVEVWDNDSLVGGLYGMILGRIFCGESMFSVRENASKTALLVFSQHFRQYGGILIDCQILNPHTASLGAREIPRAGYLNQINQFATCALSPDCWQPQTLFSLRQEAKS